MRAYADIEDPFGSAPESSGGEAPGSGGQPRPPRKKRLPPARKVAYSAIGAALSVVMITIAAWLPVTVAPLVLISICYHIVSDKCGIGYGVITMLVIAALGSLCSAANVAAPLLVAAVVAASTPLFPFFLPLFTSSHNLPPTPPPPPPPRHERYLK